MAMIKCPECGKEISDLAEKCPNCGFPIGFQSAFPQQPQINPYQNGTQYSQQSQPVQVHAISCEKEGNSWLGLLALVSSILGFTFILSAIIAIIDLCRRDNRKKTFSIIALCICGLWLFIGIIGLIGKDKTTNTTSNRTTSTIQEETDTKTVSKDATADKGTKPEKNELPNNETVNSSSSESKEDFIASCEEIPYKTLARNPENYVGKRIKLTVKVSQIIQGGLFDDGEYYRVYTNDTYDMWLGDEYFVYDCRIDNKMKILQDDILTVYGECDGTTTIERALTGTKEDVVSIKAIYIDLADDENDTADATQNDIDNEQDDTPTEYKSALKKAISYSETMHMSKNGIYNQLTSEYGEKFSEEAAQYAMDNIDVDWKANALAKAKEYSDTMYMSKEGIYNQLTSEYGEKFTEEEARYAVENVEADWKVNALKTAKSYQESMDMSPSAIYDQLISDYGEKFTVEEAQYAIDNLK